MSSKSRSARMGLTIILLFTAACSNPESTTSMASDSAVPPQPAAAEVAPSASMAETQSSVPPGAPPPHNVGAAEIYNFRSLDELVATSDAVVIAVVTDTASGPHVGDDPGFQLQLRQVRLEVHELLFGNAEREAILYELGWGSAGEPLDANHVAASREGDHGIYFLANADGPSVAPGSHVLINSQGRYLFHGNGDELRPANEEDTLSRQLAGQGRLRLIDDIRGAASRAREGTIQPVSPPAERAP